MLSRKIALWVLTIALVSVYPAAFWNSLRKIDLFCESVDTTTRTSELANLAQKIGVDLRGPFETSQHSGEFIAYSASVFTIGEYRCVVKANATHVTDKWIDR